jgi:hypothetical protein
VHSTVLVPHGPPFPPCPPGPPVKNPLPPGPTFQPFELIPLQGFAIAFSNGVERTGNPDMRTIATTIDINVGDVRCVFVLFINWS